MYCNYQISSSVSFDNGITLVASWHGYASSELPMDDVDNCEPFATLARKNKLKDEVDGEMQITNFIEGGDRCHSTGFLILAQEIEKGTSGRQLLKGCAPKKLTIVEPTRFLALRQKDNENSQQFAQRLRQVLCI